MEPVVNKGPKPVSDKRLRQRFRALDRSLSTHGVVTNPLNPVKRIIIDKAKLRTKDITRLGFRPVSIAIPEKGQVTSSTFRHPVSNHHIHDHGDAWVMHKDRHSALPMVLKRVSLKAKGELKTTKAPTGKKHKVSTPKGRLGGIRQGVAHLFTEGLPGIIGYGKSVLTGADDVRTKVMKGMSRRGNRALKRLRSFERETASKLKLGYDEDPTGEDPVDTATEADISGTNQDLERSDGSDTKSGKEDADKDKLRGASALKRGGLKKRKGWLRKTAGILGLGASLLRSEAKVVKGAKGLLRGGGDRVGTTIGTGMLAKDQKKKREQQRQPVPPMQQKLAVPRLSVAGAIYKALSGGA